MGVYVKTSVMQSDRPVYKKAGSDIDLYLYYLKARENWRIGPYYWSALATVHSGGRDRGACPTGVTTWYHFDLDHFDHSSITVVAQVEDSAAPRAGGAGTLLVALLALLLTGGGALGTGP
jgi:hypothetical protein